MDSSDQMLFNGKLTLNTIPEFDLWLQDRFKRYFHEFYVISDSEDCSMLGYIYSFEYFSSDMHCKLCLVIKKEYRNTGIGAEAAIRFMDELFRNYPLRKIFSTVFDYNKQSLMNNIQAGFKEEGCFKEYRYYDGEFHDMHILSISRDDFYNKYSFVIRRNNEKL